MKTNTPCFLYLDTETSCLNAKRIVQLAAILATSTEELASINLLIKPDNWTIDPRAQEIHGISMEKATRYGVPIESALWLLDCLLEQADFMCCHNHSFDDGVVRGEYSRLDKKFEKPGICTMNLSRDHCKVPATVAMLRAGRRGYKNPSLMEAHVWATGSGFDGAHDALADVRAAMTIHRVLLNPKLRNEEQREKEMTDYRCFGDCS